MATLGAYCKYASGTLRDYRSGRTMHTRMEKHAQDLLEQFAANVKGNREKLGYSQLKLAEVADLSTTYINDIEHARRWASAESMQKLADALLVEPWMLLSPERPAMEPVDLDFIKAVARQMEETVTLTLAETMRESVYSRLRGGESEEATAATGDSAADGAGADSAADGAGAASAAGDATETQRRVSFDEAGARRNPFRSDEPDAGEPDAGESDAEEPGGGGAEDAPE